MDAETLFYAILSMAMGVTSLELVIYVHIKSTSTRVVRVFFMVMLYFAFSAMFSGLMLLDIAMDTALLLGKLAGFCNVMSFTSFLYLAIILSKGEVNKTPLMTKVFFLLFLMVALITGLFIDDVSSVRDGWVFEGTGFELMVSITSALIIVTTAILLQQLRRSANEGQKRQLVLLILAITSPILFGTLLGSLLVLDIGMPRVVHPIETLGVLVALTYAVFRYHIIIVEPVHESKERPTTSPSPSRSIPGKSYIIESKRSETAYAILMEELNMGAQGLIVSREHPDHIRKQYGPARTPIVWLTNTLGQDHVDPSNITIIERVISDFLRNGERPIVLLDGIEVLILNNKVEKVLQMLFNLRDEFIISTGTFLLSVDPRTVDEKMLAILEKDLELWPGVDWETS